MSNTGINIAILGKSGVGKSTFCNYIFESDVFTTGSGKPVTGWDQHFKYHSVDHKSFTLNVYDSVGIENGQYDKWKQTLDDFVRKMGPESGKKPMEWLHACMYLINAASARIEPIEEMLIKELLSLDIPLTIVLTHCDGATPSQISDLNKRLNEIGLASKDFNSASKNQSDFNKSIAQMEWDLEEAVFKLTGRGSSNKLPSLGGDIPFEISVVEACSVSVRKRSGSTERFGKGEALDYVLKNLDLMLRKKIIYYYLDEYSKTLSDARKRVFDELDSADIGFIDLIKGIVRDGSSFDIDSFLPDVDLIFPNDIGPDLSVLDSFLVELGYESENSTKTHEILEQVSSNISDRIEQIGSEIEQEMTRIGNDMENGSFFDKVGAALKMTAALFNIRGFVKEKMNIFIDGSLAYIKRVRNSI